MLVGGSSKQTIGFRYFMGLHMALCHGPIKSLNQIYVAKRTLGITPETANTTITINEPGLFGGDEKEGGIVGDLDIEFGDITQTVNSYLSSQFGTGLTPAFRGTTCLVFRESEDPAIAGGNYTSTGGGGFLTSITPYPKAWSFSVTDIPGGSFNPTKQVINVGGANGGHIIRDCLINTDWGIGLPEADLDDSTFTAVTDALFDEGFSLSMTYNQQSNMEGFITEILTHVNAVLYSSRETGLWKLKLIRDDFDPGTLPIFDETNIASLVSFERPAFGEMVNEIVLTYRPQGVFEDVTITAQDLASIQAQQGIVSQTVDFPGVDHASIASRVGQRELKQLSTPLARVRIIANREAWNVSPGDVIKLSWAALGIVEIILRVGAVDYGTLENGLIGIDALEDVFGLPTNSYLGNQPTGWADEVVDPTQAPSTLAIEMPFFVVQTTFSSERLGELNTSSAILQSVAENPAGATFGYQLHTRTGSNDFEETAKGSFAPTCQLVGALDRTTKTSISFKNFKGGTGEVIIGGYAYLNNELLRIDSIDFGTQLMNVGRGYLDSIPLAHALDDIIYFADSNDAVDLTNYAQSDSVDAKVLTQTSIGILPLASAVTDNRVMVGRQDLPYNAANIKISGVSFPTALVADISIPVTWEYQDRTQQLAIGGPDWFEVSLGAPENSTTYEVRYYNDDTATLLFTDSGLTGKQSSFTPSTAVGFNFNMRIEVEANRIGKDSFSLFSHIFSYTKPLNTRTLENADIRILENADTRTLEG